MKRTKATPRPVYGHLSHRSYTGKRLAKQHTNYPILLFLLLCLGVFMIGLSLRARAEDVSVNATSNGPPPPAPAIITSPAEGTRFTTVPITVNGTCPARFMVKLYRNDVFSGAVLCALDNTFQIQTDLFDGANDLRARVFNAVEDEGPTSPTIRVYYDRPVTPQTPTSPTTPASTSSPSAGIEPLIIKADNLYKGYYTGDEISWPLDIIGGTAPYALNIDWGDGNTSIFSRKQSGAFSIHHVYAAAGPKQDSYIIKLTASDINDSKTFLQLTVIVHDKNNVAVATPGSTSSRGGVPSVFWPIYGMTFLMALSFWLGQRREFLRLKPQLRAHK